MHVDDAVECCVIAANLAGDCLSACWPKTELIGWHYRPLDAHAQTAEMSPRARGDESVSSAEDIKDPLILIFR
jgi:hypothetical protein